MKINEVEKFLGITKATIRFYEKKGLVPRRSRETGYFNYTKRDILHLKLVIILRKLGIPVQQIADILDGTLSLNKAIVQNIITLQQESDDLSGSHALCRQMRHEEIQTMDIQHYWVTMLDLERRGAQFYSIASDHAYIPGRIMLLFSYWRQANPWYNPFMILRCILTWCFVFSFINTIFGFTKIASIFPFKQFLVVLKYSIVQLPIYIMLRRNPKILTFLDKKIAVIRGIKIVLIILGCLLFLLSLYHFYNTMNPISIR